MVIHIHFEQTTREKMLSWSLIRKTISVNVSFCPVSNLVLLHVWDLLSQPKQCYQLTLTPSVGTFSSLHSSSLLWWEAVTCGWGWGTMVRLLCPCWVLEGPWTLESRGAAGAARSWSWSWPWPWSCPSPGLPSAPPQSHRQAQCVLVSVSPNGEAIREPQ